MSDLERELRDAADLLMTTPWHQLQKAQTPERLADLLAAMADEMSEEGATVDEDGTVCDRFEMSRAAWAAAVDLARAIHSGHQRLGPAS